MSSESDKTGKVIKSEIEKSEDLFVEQFAELLVRQLELSHE